MYSPYLLSVLGVLTVIGCVGALTISSAQTHVTGYENDSIILAVSYQISNTTDWLQIRWDMVHPKHVHLIICTVQSGTQPKHSMFPENGYESRMTIIPENGSLNITHLKMEDSGTYKVSMLNNELEKEMLINFTVLPVRTEDPAPVADTGGYCICSGNISSVDVATSAWILLGRRLSSIFIAVLVLLGMHFKTWNRFRRRTLKMVPPNRQLW
ncbi:uncharacterized protein LOC122923445 [Bufo gargarizans]|uniref:uncharacterized protein LOC122923445 n=1 Tax=Bufo gargarizans TaxID=30331 RepID=UPI001CF4C6D6|nr:uncharacterized protein LOC122923445 [Bufo gargarizans]